MDTQTLETLKSLSERRVRLARVLTVIGMYQSELERLAALDLELQSSAEALDAEKFQSVASALGEKLSEYESMLSIMGISLDEGINPSPVDLKQHLSDLFNFYIQSGNLSEEQLGRFLSVFPFVDKPILDELPLYGASKSSTDSSSDKK